jgi:spore coat polysaccharide biosynthesis protein SpsF
MKLGKVGVVVAARTASTRLPGKALLPLQGLPMLTFLLRRLRGLQYGEVIVATTDLPVDDELAILAAREEVGVFRGSESDLVTRYVSAADQFGFDTVARVTADCPFVDAALVDWCISRSAEFDHFDLTTTKGQFPVGLDVEIYPAERMARLAANGKLTPTEREHLTLHFYSHGEQFVVQKIALPPGWAKTDRHFTVDTGTDYEDARRIIARIGAVDFSIPSMLQALK